MPRTGKKSVLKSASDHRTSDVTLADYANCKVSAGRLRKSTSNSFVREAKTCSSLEGGWDNPEEEEEEFTQENKTNLKPSGKPRKSIKVRLPVPGFSGQDYPLDLWYLLSDYISPEDIHVFASLCKSSLYVVSTYKFWISLYRRYYCTSAPLPEPLLPPNIERPRFLRLSVIRALHYLYPPFAKRVVSSRWVDHQAYHLLQLRCVALWHCHSDNKWTFYFKFCSASKSPFVLVKQPHFKPQVENWEGMSTENGVADQVSWLADVNANPEDGCCILKLVCRHYTSVPPSVLGHWLADIKVTLTTDMRCHRVQLFFGSQSYHCSPKRRANRLGDKSSFRAILEVVEFSPVENVNVYHWWHPQYPVS